MSWKIKIDPADKLFSQWIRLRDKKCLRCNSLVLFNTKGLPITHQASHFQGRKKEATRFDPENVVTLCTGCHMYFTAHPAEHYAWQVARLGEEAVQALVIRSNSYQKKDRVAEKLYWQQKIKEMA